MYKLIFVGIVLSHTAFASPVIINLDKQPVATKDSIQTQPIHKKMSDIESYLIKVAHQFEINPLLIQAIIYAESNFQIHAQSPKGAVGLMQVMPSTASLYGDFNLFNPKDNIYVGTKHFAYLLNRYQSIPIALAAYNAGEGNVDKYGGIPPFKETKMYIIKVLTRYNQALKSTMPPQSSAVATDNNQQTDQIDTLPSPILINFKDPQ